MQNMSDRHDAMRGLRMCDNTRFTIVLTAYLYWCFKLEKNRLRDEDFPCLCAEETDL